MAYESWWIIHKQTVTYSSVPWPIHVSFEKPMILASQGSHSDWKTWKNGKAFSSQGKVGEFWTDWKSQGKVREKSGKITQNTGKLREFEINIIWYFYILFLVIFKWTVYCAKMDQVFSKENKTLKKYWKIGKKYCKSQGKVREFCQSGKVGTLASEMLFNLSLLCLDFKYPQKSHFCKKACHGRCTFL